MKVFTLLWMTLFFQAHLNVFAQENCGEKVFESILNKTDFGSSKNPNPNVTKSEESGITNLTINNTDIYSRYSKITDLKGNVMHEIYLGAGEKIATRILLDSNCKMILTNYDPRDFRIGAASYIAFPRISIPLEKACYSDELYNSVIEVNIRHECDILLADDLKSIWIKDSEANFPAQVNYEGKASKQ